MMRKSAVLECGGYDTELRALGAQGCEDLKLYLQIAERYDFAVVPLPLTGYRRSSRSMSADINSIIRSHRLVLQPYVQRYPEYNQNVRTGHVYLTMYYIQSSLRFGDFWHRLQSSPRDLPIRFPAIREGACANAHQLGAHRADAPDRCSQARGHEVRGPPCWRAKRRAKVAVERRTMAPARLIDTVGGRFRKGRSSLVSAIRQIAILAPGHGSVTAWLIALGIVGAIAESLGITLIVLLLHVAVGSASSQLLLPGVLGRLSNTFMRSLVPTMRPWLPPSSC